MFSFDLLLLRRSLRSSLRSLLLLPSSRLRLLYRFRDLRLELLEYTRARRPSLTSDWLEVVVSLQGPGRESEPGATKEGFPVHINVSRCMSLCNKTSLSTKILQNDVLTDENIHCPQFPGPHDTVSRVVSECTGSDHAGDRAIPRPTTQKGNTWSRVRNPLPKPPGCSVPDPQIRPVTRTCSRLGSCLYGPWGRRTTREDPLGKGPLRH